MPSAHGADEEKGTSDGERVERKKRGWCMSRTAAGEHDKVAVASHAAGVASCGGGDAEFCSVEQRDGSPYYVRNRQILKRHGITFVR